MISFTHLSIHANATNTYKPCLLETRAEGILFLQTFADRQQAVEAKRSDPQIGDAVKETVPRPALID